VLNSAPINGTVGQEIDLSAPIVGRVLVKGDGARWRVVLLKA